jgi:predicted Zn finger-like uncharacterized protein
MVEARTRPSPGLTSLGSARRPWGARPTRYGFQFVNGSDGSTGLGVVILIRAMLIVCPCCTTSYTVRPNSLRPYGQTRCLRCLAIWSPQRHRADMLIAAAAAIGDDFAPLPELNLPEAGAGQSGDSGNVEVASFQPDPIIFDEQGIANLDPAWSGVGESVDATAGPEEAPANHEIYFVDLEPDNPPIVPEAATVDQGGEGVVVEQGTETIVVPEPAIADLTSVQPAGPPDQFVSPDVNVAPEARGEQPLHMPEHETPAIDEQVSAPARNEWVPNYSVAENTENETSANRAVAAFAEKPGAIGEEEGGSDWATSGGSGAVEASEHETTVLREPRPDARRWIVLKANNSKSASSKKTTDLTLSNVLRSGRNLPVPSRGWPPPTRQRVAPRWPVTKLQAGIIALALVDFLLVGWRTDIVRKLPQTASFYELAGVPVNLRGLAFRGITTTTVRDGGKPVLVVEGDIVNNTAKSLRVPQLRFAVRDAADQEIYFWTATASRASLPPGQAVAFRARLASPPPGARDVVLRFVNRRDAVAMNP